MAYSTQSHPRTVSPKRDTLAATYRDGSLWWRSTFRTPDEMRRQAAEFRAIEAENDWFSDAAGEFARQCEAALAAYERDQRKVA